MNAQKLAHHFAACSAVFGLAVASVFAIVVVTSDSVALANGLGMTPNVQPAAAVLGTQAAVLIATSTPAQPISVSSNFCPSFSEDLQKGTYDRYAGQGDVSDLQRFLASYYAIDPSQLVTGYFGSTTESLVVEFQDAHGLPDHGYVGPLTRAAIAQTCAGAVSSAAAGTDVGVGSQIPSAAIAFSSSPTSGPVPLSVAFTAVSTQNLAGAEIAYGDGKSGKLTAGSCNGSSCTYLAQYTYATPGVYDAAVSNGKQLFVILVTVASSTL